MAFALEHAEAAGEVADVLISALLVDGTPVPRKVARLHLICDILHNSAVSLPGAWRFRGEFQSRLGVVFDHLSGIYHSFPGRITAETFKAQIGAVVDIWEDWIVFPPEFTAELRARLEGQAGLAKVEDEEKSSAMPVPVAKEVAHEPSSRFKASSFKPATAIIELELDGEPIDDDVDGVPMEDDVDGMPMEDLDGAPVKGGEDLDGVPMEDLDGASVESLDGAPIGDDVDGAPLENVDGAPVQDLEGEDVGVNATQDDGEPMEMDSDDD
jgi:U2-associated protein SR140